MTIHLTDMPEDVRAHILKVQMQIKLKKKIGKYSQQLALYQIVREHILLTEKEKK